MNDNIKPDSASASRWVEKHGASGMAIKQGSRLPTLVPDTLAIVDDPWLGAEVLDKSTESFAAKAYSARALSDANGQQSAGAGSHGTYPLGRWEVRS